MVEDGRRLANRQLTERERTILRLLTDGLTNSEIAETVAMTIGTVKWYNRQIYGKLGVRNRAEAITRAQQNGLLRTVSSSPTPPNNIFSQITSFVGRIREIAELKELLLTSRLVTLTGPPGTGKTRLALELAAELLDRYPDGVYFVSLASIKDANLVAHTVAQTLDVKESGSDSDFSALTKALRRKHVLLVLDNFEHLLDAALLVPALLEAAPHLSVLVTSREILRLYGEQDFPVPPLQLPDLNAKMSAKALCSCEAIELFTQRARAAQPGFTLSDDNGPAVAMICVHLDGLPLAIELAAARVRFYAPQTLLIRLAHRLDILSGGARDLPARQRTLRATLAWSYDLLMPEEQRLFARLGVFAGGFSSAEAQAICADDLYTDIREGMESLLNKSLLRHMRVAAPERRFTMLETLREYALEKLVEFGEIEHIRERHAHYFLVMTERAAKERNQPSAVEWLDRLEIQHDNLHAALRWCLADSTRGETCLRFVGSLASFWQTRGYFSEGRAWIAEALRLTAETTPTTARADALLGAGRIAYLQCDYTATRQFHEDALNIYRKVGDRRGVAYALVGLADMETALGAYDIAEATFLEAVEEMKQVGDTGGTAFALCLLAWCPLRSSGDYAQATAWFEQSLAMYTQVGNSRGIALAYSGLGEIAVRQGELERAEHLLEQSLRVSRSLGEKWNVAATLGTLAWAAQIQGDFERANALLGESLLMRKDIGDPGGIAWCLEKLAAIAHLQADNGRAALIFGAAAALRASFNSTIDPADRPEHDRLIAHVRARLGEDIYAAVWADGQAMPLESLVEFLALSTQSASQD